MDKAEVIQKIASQVKELFQDDSTGHDWWHIYRVWQLAIRIGKQEGADLFIVELGALLHDISDYKFNGGDETAGGQKAELLLKEMGVDGGVIKAVCHIVDNVSFKGAKVKNKMKGIEGLIVQDADRLDGLGAMGIARTFTYGGSTGAAIYNPDSKPQLHGSFEEYKKRDPSSVNHFYEKLLLIKDMMNTDAARKIAEHRHRFMEDFLEEFMKEWDGQK